MSINSYKLYMNVDAAEPTVNRPVPLYEYVKQQISEWILSGAYAEGTVLPSEAALALQFRVAVGTVRHALADLVSEGLVARRRRVGTVVTGRPPQSLRFFFHYFRLHAADGALVHSTTSVLRLARAKATAAEASSLQVAPATAVIRIRRLRHVHGTPVMVEDLTLPADLVPGFPARAAYAPPLLYLYLLREHGVRVMAVREHLTADLATASERTALALATPAAVLRIRSTSYDATGRVALLGAHVADTTGHSYVNEVR
jgi:GntR family transcriptional regulator